MLQPGRSLSVERFTRVTCSSPWTSAGPEEPLDLDPPGESRYVGVPTG